MAAPRATESQQEITAPNLQVATFRITGIAPYVQLKFSEKGKNEMEAKQAAGSVAKASSRARKPKDFDELYEECIHYSEEGWAGIPAPAFRNGMISACRLVGMTMTLAKLAVFVIPDGIDREDATPLVRITQGEPSKFLSICRNATGVIDLRVRAKWGMGWQAEPQVQFDADVFSLNNVTNLLARVGAQVGIGEGRPDSKKSAGMGWGLFRLDAPEA